LDIGDERQLHMIADHRGPGPTAHGRRRIRMGEPRITVQDDSLPLLLTADETADILRTSRKAVYMMVERGAIEGVVRIGRRMLFRRDDLLHWLCQKSTPSPKDERR